MSKCARPRPRKDRNLPKLSKRVDLVVLVRMYKQKFLGFEEVYIGLSTTLDFVCGKDNRNYKQGEKYKKDHHQRRLTNKAIDGIVAKLDALNLNANDIKDFDELIELVRKPSIKYFKYCNSYDFSFRYGLNHGIKPEKYVYIHAGARKGAEALRDAGYIEFDSKANRLPIESFPPELEELSAYDIENFLCVMKTLLSNLKPKSK